MRTIKAGADQPAHPRSLISAFIVRCLDSIIISLLAIADISKAYLVSSAEQAGFSLPALAANPEDRFSRVEAQIMVILHEYSF